MSLSWIKVALVALGISVVPVSYALADAGSQATPVDAKDKGKCAEKRFPMEGAKFVTKVDERIAKRRTKLGEKLASHNVAADKREAILKDYDAGAAQVRTVAKEAAKDGTVTIDEAKHVRNTVKDARRDLAKKYNLGKEGKGKANGKGKAKGKKKKDKGTPA